MNLIKLLLFALLAVAALLGGFLVAAVIAAGAAATWLVRRFVLKPGVMQLPSRTTSPHSPSPSPEASHSDVIDIAATEIPTTSHRP